MLTQEVGSFFKRFIFTKTNSKDFEYWHGCGIQFEKKHILGLMIMYVETFKADVIAFF
jgi:hypothetical protein